MILNAVLDDSKLLSCTLDTLVEGGESKHCCLRIFILLSFFYLFACSARVQLMSCQPRVYSLLFSFAVADFPCFFFVLLIRHANARELVTRRTAIADVSMLRLLAHRSLISTPWTDSPIPLHIFPFILLPAHLVYRRYCSTSQKSSSRIFRSYALGHTGHLHRIR